MSDSEMNSEVLESEAKIMEAKGLLNTLYFLNNRDDANAMIPQMKKVVLDKDFNCLPGQETVRKLLLDNSEQIKKISRVFDFLKNYKKTDARVKHDLGNIASMVEGLLGIYLGSAQQDDVMDIADLDRFLANWDRYLVGVEDILLRIIAKDKLLSEHNNGTDVEVLGGAIGYFSIDELRNIRSFSKESDSAYKEIDDKKIDIASSADWDKLALELKNKEIAGNSGLVANFLLNALRNSLKDRVEAKNVRLTAAIKGDSFVLRVEDDGKGIAAKFLQPDYKEKNEVTGEEKDIYIFHEGASGTGSTGIGLADFDTRLASVGGELYVVSKPKYEKEDGLVRFQYGSTPEKANEVEFDQSLEHGTVFEIRLPITQKQK